MLGANYPFFTFFVAVMFTAWYAGLGPALVALRFDHLWVYVTAPFIGASAAVLACRCVQDQTCCRGLAQPKGACS